MMNKSRIENIILSADPSTTNAKMSHDCSTAERATGRMQGCDCCTEQSMGCEPPPPENVWQKDYEVIWGQQQEVTNQTLPRPPPTH